MAMFTKAEKHRVSVTQNDKCPYNDNDVIILAEQTWTMDDGVEIEFCLWCESGYDYIDVSVNKEKFAEKIGDDFVSYLKSKEIPTENYEEANGGWIYSGEVKRDDVFRVQYYWDED